MHGLGPNTAIPSSCAKRRVCEFFYTKLHYFFILTWWRQTIHKVHVKALLASISISKFWHGLDLSNCTAQNWMFWINLILQMHCEGAFSPKEGRSNFVIVLEIFNFSNLIILFAIHGLSKNIHKWFLSYL